MDNVRSQTYAAGYYLAWFKIFKSIKGEKRKIHRGTQAFMTEAKNKIYFKDVHLSKNIHYNFDQSADELIAKFVATQDA